MTSPTHPKAKDWAFLTALTVFWGASYALIAVALEGYPPLTIVMVRMYISAAIGFAWALTIGRRVPRLVRPEGGIAPIWLYFLAMSIAGNVAPFFLVSWGQTAVSSSLTGILVAIMPLVTLALAHILITHERITLTRLLGYALGFGGIVVLLGVGALRGLGGEGALHQFAIVGAALCYSVNAIIVRFMPGRDPFMSAAVVSLIAAVLATPLALSIDQPWTLTPSWPATAALIALGVMSTGFATIVYFALIHSAGPTFMSLTNYLAPPFAVVLGVFLLGEKLETTALMALAMILAGVGLTQLRGSRSSPSSTVQPGPKD